MFLGQVKVESKSNEITAIPALLELSNISGSIITIDAMGTQHQIAHRIVTLGADYVLALKANHPTLHTQVKQWFGKVQGSDFEGIEYSYDVLVESGHHRQLINIMNRFRASPLSQSQSVEFLFSVAC